MQAGFPWSSGAQGDALVAWWSLVDEEGYLSKENVTRTVDSDGTLGPRTPMDATDATSSPDLKLVAATAGRSGEVAAVFCGPQDGGTGRSCVARFLGDSGWSPKMPLGIIPAYEYVDGVELTDSGRLLVTVIRRVDNPNHVRSGLSLYSVARASHRTDRLDVVPQAHQPWDTSAFQVAADDAGRLHSGWVQWNRNGIQLKATIVSADASTVSETRTLAVAATDNVAWSWPAWDFARTREGEVDVAWAFREDRRRAAFVDVWTLAF